VAVGRPPDDATLTTPVVGPTRPGGPAAARRGRRTVLLVRPPAGAAGPLPDAPEARQAYRTDDGLLLRASARAAAPSWSMYDWGQRAAAAGGSPRR
jgi:hypothetical protein